MTMMNAVSGGSLTWKLLKMSAKTGTILTMKNSKTPMDTVISTAG